MRSPLSARRQFENWDWRHYDSRADDLPANKETGMGLSQVAPLQVFGLASDEPKARGIYLKGQIVCPTCHLFRSIAEFGGAYPILSEDADKHTIFEKTVYNVCRVCRDRGKA